MAKGCLVDVLWPLLLLAAASMVTIGIAIPDWLTNNDAPLIINVDDKPYACGSFGCPKLDYAICNACSVGSAAACEALADGTGDAVCAWDSSGESADGQCVGCDLLDEAACDVAPNCDRDGGSACFYKDKKNAEIPEENSAGLACGEDGIPLPTTGTHSCGLMTYCSRVDGDTTEDIEMEIGSGDSGICAARYGGSTSSIIKENPVTAWKTAAVLACMGVFLLWISFLGSIGLLVVWRKGVEKLRVVPGFASLMILGSMITFGIGIKDTAPSADTSTFYLCKMCGDAASMSRGKCTSGPGAWLTLAGLCLGAGGTAAGFYVRKPKDMVTRTKVYPAKEAGGRNSPPQMVVTVKGKKVMQQNHSSSSLQDKRTPYKKGPSAASMAVANVTAAQEQASAQRFSSGSLNRTSTSTVNTPKKTPYSKNPFSSNAQI